MVIALSLVHAVAIYGNMAAPCQLVVEYTIPTGSALSPHIRYIVYTL